MTAAKVGERLPYLLAALKTPRIAERLAQTAERAREEQWPYEQFLETLCEAEVFAREASGARQRTRSAGFPAHKTLENFDFTAQPSAERPLVMHLAIALGIKACQHGHRVAFATAQQWVSRLEEAQERNTLDQELRRLERYQLLIVDLCRYRDYADTVIAAGLTTWVRWVSGRSCRSACRHSHRLSRNARVVSAGW
jgi:DNA replication protein DnaC